MKILEIPNQDSIIQTLERASYEVNCRRNIINFMINDGMNNTDNFKNYWEEFLLYSKAYDKLKYDFQNEYIYTEMGQDFTGRWEIDFMTKEIRIYD